MSRLSVHADEPALSETAARFVEVLSPSPEKVAAAKQKSPQPSRDSRRLCSGR